MNQINKSLGKSTFSRRQLLKTSSILSFASLAGCQSMLHPLIGSEKKRSLDVGTRAYVQRLKRGLDMSRVWDTHAHVIADGQQGSGGYVNPEMTEGVVGAAYQKIYLGSLDLKSSPTLELDFLEQTMRWFHQYNHQGRIVLLAFDAFFDEKGIEHKDKSTFYTPNDWVYKIAANYSQVKVAASIHPYREDALERLAKAKENGAIAVKWLPNSQGIDTSSKRCIPFYRKLAEYQMPLVVHAGEEQATESIDKDAGNPLRLRTALDEGARVVVAHCAGLGDVHDIQNGATDMHSYDAFRRLLEEKQYEKNLWADISAMTQFNRSGEALRRTIKDKEIHHRLVNASDYPLPSINFLVSTKWLQMMGYMNGDDVKQCNRLFNVNPFLYDFAVKRSLRVQEDGQEYKFSDIIFESARLFDF